MISHLGWVNPGCLAFPPKFLFISNKTSFLYHISFKTSPSVLSFLFPHVALGGDSACNFPIPCCLRRRLCVIIFRVLPQAATLHMFPILPQAAALYSSSLTTTSEVYLVITMKTFHNIQVQKMLLGFTHLISGKILSSSFSLRFLIIQSIQTNI